MITAGRLRSGAPAPRGRVAAPAPHDLAARGTGPPAASDSYRWSQDAGQDGVMWFHWPVDVSDGARDRTEERGGLIDSCVASLTRFVTFDPV